MTKVVAAIAATLALAGAATASTPDNVKLARVLKPALQKFYKSKGSDDVFTKVTCTLRAGATTGSCKAYFASASLKETGWFDITAAINRSTGGVQWRATKATCRVGKSGKPFVC